MKTNMKGFTLVEIMIVVAIIGLLIAIALPNFLEARKKAQARTCVANMRNVDGAIQQCSIEEPTTASTWDSSTEISVNYLKNSSGVYCPTLGSAGGWYAIVWVNGASSNIVCKVPTTTATDHRL